MHWYTYLFFGLAACAFFIGAGSQAHRGNGTGMSYSIFTAAVWLLLALWTGGFLP